MPEEEKEEQEQEEEEQQQQTTTRKSTKRIMGNKTIYFHSTPINYNDSLRKMSQSLSS
jgi:hypothetical protein